MKHKIFLFAVLLMSLICVVLVSCGPDIAGTTPAATTTAGTPAATTTAPAVTTTAPAVTTTAPVVTTTEKPLLTASPVFDGVSGTYNGSAFSVAVSNLPEGSTVSYSVDGGAATETVSLTNAGTYTVVATITLPDTYAPVQPMTATVTIAKAKIDMSAVQLAADTKTYNGSAFTLSATGIPANVAATYTYKLGSETVTEVKNAGTYTVIATFASTDANYEVAAADATKEATLTVNKAKIDMSAVQFVDATKPYNGTAYVLEATGLPADVKATYAYQLNGNAAAEAKDSGVYSVTVTFSSTNANYEIAAADATKTATLTIEPVKVTVGDLTLNWVYTSMEGYDAELNAICVAAGSTFSYAMVLDDASLVALTEGVTVTYTTVKVAEDGTTTPVDGAVSALGTYKTVVTFGSTTNCQVEDAEFTMEISWAVCLTEEDSWSPIA